MKTERQQKAIDITLFLLRLAIAVIFIQVGGLKLFGWFGGMPPGVPVTGLILVAGILEVVGGVLIALGLFTRPAAFIVSGEMAVAYFLGHFSLVAPWPIQNHGEPAVLLCFTFLFLAAYGAGKISLDALVRNKRAKAVVSA